MGYGHLTITPDPDRALSPLYPHDYPYTYKEAYEWKLFIVLQAENNFKGKGYIFYVTANTEKYLSL